MSLYVSCKKTLGLILVIMVLVAEVTEAQKRRGGGGRRRGGRKKGLKVWKSKESQAYYDNENGAKIIDWSHFESEYTLGRKIVFQCSAEGTPRPHITWFKNGIELYSHAFFMTHEWDMGEIGKKSKMEIDPATHMDAGYYECMADNQYAVDVKGFSTDFSLEFE